MGQATTIEDRTEKFISAYNRLKKKGLLPDNQTLATELGYKSDASISEILGRRQNIPPKKWQLFLEKWPAANDGPLASDYSEPQKHYFTADQLFQMYMKSVERQDKIMETQTALLASIKNEMARADAQASAKISLDRIAGDVTKLVERQYTAIEEFRDEFSELKARKNNPLKDSGKKGDRSGDGSGKTGTLP